LLPTAEESVQRMRSSEETSRLDGIRRIHDSYSRCKQRAKELLKGRDELISCFLNVVTSLWGRI
jgi:hypothetical protein